MDQNEVEVILLESTRSFKGDQVDSGENFENVLDTRTLELMNFLFQNNPTNEQLFFKSYKLNKRSLTDEQKSLLLFMAIQNNSVVIVSEIAKDMKDVHTKIPQLNFTPLRVACVKEYYDIVDILIQYQSHAKALIEMLKVEHIAEKTFQKYIETLLEQADIDVNEQDWNGNTALHFAVEYRRNTYIHSLLRKGASLATRNHQGIMPIQDIQLDLLESFLNECFQKRYDDVQKATYLEVSFTSLFPTGDVGPTGARDPCPECLFDIEFFHKILQLPHLKPFLTHPVMMTYFFLKWYTVQAFYYMHLALYLLYFTSLFFYIFFSYAADTPVPACLMMTSNVIALVATVILVILELAQLCFAKLRYFLQFENILECALFGMSLYVLASVQNDEAKQVSAVAIILASSNLLLLLGKHPKLSTKIIMFRLVFFEFVKLFCYFAILIVAFATSFHMLLKSPKADDSFNYFWLSLFKTAVMLTSEFDTSQINFQSHKVVSHLTFLLFVFMIVIILLSLMNGLAVSDIQMIKSNAEYYSTLAKINNAIIVEKIFLYFLNGSKMKCLGRLRDLLFPLRVSSKMRILSDWKIFFGDVMCIEDTQYNQSKHIVLNKSTRAKILDTLKYNENQKEHKLLKNILRTNQKILEKLKMPPTVYQTLRKTRKSSPLLKTNTY